MTFQEFVYSRSEKDRRMRDLIGEIQVDPLWPSESNDRSTLRFYLLSMNASEACLKTFDRAYEMYKKAGGPTAFKK